MTILLIGMSVIVLTTLAGGWLARKVGQSRVVGEIVGGILLGPSLFGRLAPDAAKYFFQLRLLPPLKLYPQLD